MYVPKHLIIQEIVPRDLYDMFKEPAQFEDQRQKKWYSEKYSFIVRMREFWNAAS